MEARNASTRSCPTFLACKCVSKPHRCQPNGSLTTLTVVTGFRVLFNDPNYETYKHGQQFMIVDHTANQRNGSEVSKIWQHGGERRRVDDSTMDRYWRCGHCNNKRI